MAKKWLILLDDSFASSITYKLLPKAHIYICPEPDPTNKTEFPTKLQNKIPEFAIQNIWQISKM